MKSGQARCEAGTWEWAVWIHTGFEGLGSHWVQRVRFTLGTKVWVHTGYEGQGSHWVRRVLRPAQSQSVGMSLQRNVRACTPLNTITLRAIQNRKIKKRVSDLLDQLLFFLQKRTACPSPPVVC